MGTGREGVRVCPWSRERSSQKIVAEAETDEMPLVVGETAALHNSVARSAVRRQLQGGEGYVLISEGTCESMAAGPVTRKAECQTAAAALYSDPTATRQRDSSYPAYCWLGHDTLYYNSYSASTQECSETHECICVAHSPSPPFPPAMAPLPPPFGGPFVLIDSGTCDSVAGGPVASAADCGNAAYWLGIRRS